MRTLLMLRSMMLTAALLAGLMVKPPAVAAATPFILAPGANQFAVFMNTICAISDQHSLYCWGDNTWASMAQPKKKQHANVPLRVGTGKWRSVYSGAGLCAIKWDRSVWCWGEGVPVIAQGRQEFRGPILVTQRKARSVEAIDSNHGMCIRAMDRSLWCWVGTRLFFRQGWHQVERQPIISATSYGSAICYLLVTNKMKCWGTNSQGDFPTGPGTPRAVKKPRLVSGDYLQLMRDYSCALDLDGYQRCWGILDSLPQRIGSSWAETFGGLCSRGFCVVTPSRVEDILWDNLWSDQCGLLQSGQVSCSHTMTGERGQAIGTTSLEGSWSEVEVSQGLGCGRKDEGQLWCWGLNDFATDSVSGPRLFGVDASDYTLIPYQVTLP
jgi:hypothetical protein